MDRATEHKFILLDNDNNEICICRFEKEYEKTSRLSGYFLQRETNEDSHKIFGNIKSFDETNAELHGKLSTDAKVLQFPIFSNAEQATLTNDDKVEDTKTKAIVSIEDFFHDEPDSPYHPLFEHSLEQSPCYPIINKRGEFYYCKLHPKVSSIHLDSIEQHCKYKDPYGHKAELLKHLNLS